MAMFKFGHIDLGPTFSRRNAAMEIGPRSAEYWAKQDKKASKKAGYSKRKDCWSRYNTHLNYEALEGIKEVLCRIPHPTGHMRLQNYEYRLSILPWSRGGYLDIRQYRNGQSTNVGILLHLDIMEAILPDIVGAVRTLAAMDGREPGTRAQVKVIHC